jgi:hypothetical protein
MVERVGDMYRFRIFLPHARCVHLVGDFTDWDRGRVALRRVPPGWWVVELPVERCLSTPDDELTSGMDGRAACVSDRWFCYVVDEALRLADYGADGVKLHAGGVWLSRMHPGGKCDVVVRAPASAGLATASIEPNGFLPTDRESRSARQSVA